MSRPRLRPRDDVGQTNGVDVEHRRRVGIVADHARVARNDHQVARRPSRARRADPTACRGGCDRDTNTAARSRCRPAAARSTASDSALMRGPRGAIGNADRRRRRGSSARAPGRRGRRRRALSAAAAATIVAKRPAASAAAKLRLLRCRRSSTAAAADEVPPRFSAQTCLAGRAGGLCRPGRAHPRHRPALTAGLHLANVLRRGAAAPAHQPHALRARSAARTTPCTRAMRGRCCGPSMSRGRPGVRLRRRAARG